MLHLTLSFQSPRVCLCRWPNNVSAVSADSWISLGQSACWEASTEELQDLGLAIVFILPVTLSRTAVMLGRFPSSPPLFWKGEWRGTCKNGFLPPQLRKFYFFKKWIQVLLTEWKVSFPPKYSCYFLYNFVELLPDRPGSGCRCFAIKILEWFWGLAMHLWFLAGPGLFVEIPVGLFPFATGLLTEWITYGINQWKFHLCDINHLKLHKTLSLH